MFCEARTSTGLGCDGLGLEQCHKCKPVLKYSFTCHAARYTTHCEAFGYKPCTVCADYELGLYEPHYPVPATSDNAVLANHLKYRLSHVMVRLIARSY